MHDNNTFITLTYNDDNLPLNNSLHYPHWQAFMRRLRKAAIKRATILTDLMKPEPTAGSKLISNGPPATNQDRLRPFMGLRPIPPLSFYMCGEYGEIYGRPHYHALIFGMAFADATYETTTRSGSKIYSSATLQELWPHGFTSIGEVNFESAAYVARYVMKKRTGDGNKTEYQIIDLDTGEINKKTKEFNQMSRHNSIGKSWLNKYSHDVYTQDHVIMRGHPNPPPRYYDKLYKKVDAARMQAIKDQRELEARRHKEHHTPARLAVQELVAAAKTKSLKRNLT